MQIRIKKAIKDRKLKIGELASSLGCCRQTLSNFLNCKGTLNSDLLLKLLDLLGFKLCLCD